MGLITGAVRHFPSDWASAVSACSRHTLLPARQMDRDDPVQSRYGAPCTWLKQRESRAVPALAWSVEVSDLCRCLGAPYNSLLNSVNGHLQKVCFEFGDMGGQG